MHIDTDRRVKINTNTNTNTWPQNNRIVRKSTSDRTEAALKIFSTMLIWNDFVFEKFENSLTIKILDFILQVQDAIWTCKLNSRGVNNLKPRKGDVMSVKHDFKIDARNSAASTST